MRSTPENPISLLIVEDETASMNRVASIITAHFPGFAVHGVGTVAAAREHCETHRPQLLLLDVNLPDGDAFALLERFRSGWGTPFRVIFITGHAGHALRAIKFSALDFLLKPFTEADLVEAVARAQRQIADDRYQKQLDAFSHNMTMGDEGARIVLKTSDETHVVPIADIVRIEAYDNYCRFYRVEGDPILITQPLKVFERRLDGSGFIRAHQSHLVHLRHVRVFSRKKMQLKLVDGSEVPVSLGKKNEVQTALDRLSIA